MQRIRDTPVGAIFGVALIVACFSMAGTYFTGQFRSLQDERSVFQGLKLREGFVALSDLQRVTLVVLGALREGEMTSERAADLEAALDFLYVRNDAFRTRLLPEAGSESARAALAQMEHVVALVEAAKARRFDDLPELSGDLIETTNGARQHLFSYLDDKRRSQDMLMNDQQDRIEHQLILLLAFLFCLTIAGSAALLLLRRESRMRRELQISEGRARFLAYYDALTGLPNRVLFRDRVQAHLAEGLGSAMVFVDLDQFKDINDTFGHSTGDTVLKAVARILEKTARDEGGLAARLAGDEFALFLPTDDIRAVAEIGEGVIAACSVPVTCDNFCVSFGISLGVATGALLGETDATFEHLLKKADFALYAAKAAGRGRVTVFDADLEAEFNGRRALVSELPFAIERGEIEVFLQPKILIGSGLTYGFEALARWNRDGQRLAPSEFVELAESSGAVIELDLHVLRASTRLIADWNARCGMQLSISANLSAAHFRTGSIVDEVADALRVSGLPPVLLTLEITETIQILNWEQVHVALAKIRGIGCRIAIDDFGSGYSSLAYLRAIEADELKIDRSLVSEIEQSDEALFILDSVVDLAHSLRMEVVVEGVETESQLRSVEALGCRKAQGFLISQPLPADEALRLFGTKSPVPVLRSAP